jgi:hypothetical protein
MLEKQLTPRGLSAATASRNTSTELLP